MAGDGDAAPSAASGAGLVLIMAAGGSVPRAFAMTGGAALIGRRPPRGGWTIDQSAVSRVHATLQASDAGLRVRDMGSRNGTFVNGERVTEARVRGGDVVRIGDAAFVVVEQDAEAHLPFRVDAPAGPTGLAGGLSMARLLGAVETVARGEATVLVYGETGSGKELVAQAIHRASGRRGPLVALNCAAVPAGVFEAELFGYERGAFTGAVRAHPGLVRAADGGTLLLDEIGELPTEAQAKLLRVLETRDVLAIGASSPRRVDVRVVCATHQDLLSRVEGGTFRGDLYARIAQRTLRVPPLRARKEDIFALVLHVLRSRPGPAPSVGFGFVHRLALHDWPFNVRELVGVVEHAVEQSRGEELQAAHVGDIVTRRPGPADATGDAREPAKTARRKGPSPVELRDLLARETGNVARVARALERDPAQIYRWMRQYGIRPEEFR
jgi:transcriptional regulator with GAF, ATPase, and Fis domain